MLRNLYQLLLCQLHEGADLLWRSLEVLDRKGVHAHAAYVQTHAYLEHLEG